MEQEFFFIFDLKKNYVNITSFKKNNYVKLLK